MSGLRRIGILQPDAVLEQFRGEFGDYPAMLADVLNQAANPGECLEYTAYDVMRGEYPAELGECDAYVITGSRASVYDEESWIQRLEDYVRVLHAARHKLVGICFGHQMVARALGGATEAAAVGWGVGIAESAVVNPGDFMQPALKRFNLLVSHRDQVTRLPKGATVHAGSGFCPISIFTVGRHILALQGHPEFVAEYSKVLMNMRRDLLGEPVWSNGVASLEAANDRATVARWILNFIFG